MQRSKTSHERKPRDATRELPCESKRQTRRGWGGNVSNDAWRAEITDVEEAKLRPPWECGARPQPDDVTYKSVRRDCAEQCNSGQGVVHVKHAVVDAAIIEVRLADEVASFYVGAWGIAPVARVTCGRRTCKKAQ